MLPVSYTEKWDKAVRGSHVATLRCELWNQTEKLKELYPNSGSITIDARRDVRRSCSIELVDQDGTLTPTASNLELAPYGNELRIFRGIDYGDGTSDEVQLGVFAIVETNIIYGDSGTTINITADDRAKTIQQRPFTTPYGVGPSLNMVDSMINIVRDRFPGLANATTSTTYVTPSGTRILGSGQNSNPWADVQDIAFAIGQEAYFDNLGQFATSPVPSLDATNYVAAFTDESDGVTISIDRTFTLEGIHNGVLLTAEGTHLPLPLTVEIWDDDATSPFNRTGPVGERGESISSSWILTQNQCTAAALSEYQAVRGQAITITIVPDPRIDVRDIIKITATDLGIDTTAIIDTIEIPFDISGSMTITARTKGY